METTNTVPTLIRCNVPTAIVKGMHCILSETGGVLVYDVGSAGFGWVDGGPTARSVNAAFKAGRVGAVRIIATPESWIGKTYGAGAQPVNR